MLAIRDEDASFLRMELSCDHLEDGGLSCAILPHEGDLGSLSYGERRFIEEPLGCDMAERHFIESDNSISLGHNMGGVNEGFRMLGYQMIL